jgi:hypothetical protein
MIVQVVYLEAKAESLENFIKEAAANAEKSRQEAGVIQFDLLQHGDEPTKFMTRRRLKRIAPLCISNVGLKSGCRCWQNRARKCYTATQSQNKFRSHYGY